ncbi:MAG: hypothetical protein ABI599_03855 [Flavobacteriales bacterium]
MKERTTRMLRILSRLMALLVPVLLFAYGTWSFPLAVFGPDRALLPGDMGDSRFDNYMLEHFHQFASGKVGGYWNAPFMYPQKNVTAFSDSLVGTAPLYSFFRHIGFNRESAYQLWMLVLFALNYLCCFVALFAWSRRSVLSACGAYVFAFGIHMLGQMDHAQVFPRFMVPLAFWWCWQWLEAGRPKYFLFMLLATVYQFYCGAHLGFVLCCALLFLVVGHVVVHVPEIRRYRPAGWRPLLLGAGILVLAALLLLPLALPYLEAAHITDVREFGTTKSTIPQLHDYFVSHPAALSWRSLSMRSGLMNDEGSGNLNFMGALPWLAILLLPLALWKSRSAVVSRRSLGGIAIAFLLALVFCLRIGDVALYSVIDRLPGFGLMRPIDRFVPVLAMYFALVLVVVFSAAWHAEKPWLNVVLSVVLPFAIAMDNKVDVRELMRYDKHAAREMVERAKLEMQLQTDTATRAVAYAPARGVMDSVADHARSSRLHLTAMLAAQELGIPAVNAYAVAYPATYLRFWENLDQRGLDAWCASNGIAADGIAMANNIHMPVLFVDTVALLAANGKYLCLDPTWGNKGVADRDSAGSWETFVRLRLRNGRCAFVAHDDRFLSVELHHDSGLVAVSDRLGDMGLFRMEEHSAGAVALRADNDRYLTLDTLSHRIFANGDSTNPLRLLKLRRIVRGSERPSAH